MIDQTSNQQEEFEEFGGIFNLTGEDYKAKEIVETVESDPDFYRPSIDHEKARSKKHYESLIRRVPNVHNREIQQVKKYVYYIPDPNDPTGQKHFYTDCPTNDGKKSIVSQAYFELNQKVCDDIRLNKIARKYFLRKLYTWGLFLIKKDEFQPELEGKVKILRYGVKISEKEDQQEKLKNPCYVADPFKGKDLNLIVTEVTKENGDKQVDYDKSYFEDERNSITIDGQFVVNDKEGQKKIYEFLKSNSPDLSKVSYKPWTPEEEEKVIMSVRNLISNDIIFDKIYKKVYGKSFFVSSPIEQPANPEPNLENQKKYDSPEPNRSANAVVNENPDNTSIDEETFDITNIEIDFDKMPE
jgi:hypothetical protein